ncbi:MAG TPA: hypothetical protein PL193_07590 [Xanthobacteraceae bacterium]|nr:hypothetical protein [Xanthobacteraceae bacterium]
MANKSTGVEVRFSVKDFESVVAALRASGDAGDAMARRLEMAGRAGSRGLNAIDTAAAGIRDRARALSGELGLVGNVLQSIGPWGLAAGAGIAVVAIAFKKLLEFADRFAEKAQKIRDVAEAAQLTSDGLQALREAGQDVSVAGEKVDAFAGRFAVGMNELRQGQGELFKIINQIDPKLTRQLALAKDMESAWNLLAQAYKRASDAQRLDITKAVAGQRNIGAGLILEQIADAGGLQAYADKARATGEILDRELIKRLAKLRTENDSLKDSIENTLGSIFSESALRSSNQFLSNIKEILDHAAGFKASADFSKLIDAFTSKGAAGVANVLGVSGTMPTLQAILNAVQALKQLPSPFSEPDGQVVNGVWVPGRARSQGKKGGLPFSPPNPDYRPTPDNANAPKFDPDWILNQMRAALQILGSAATPAEQRELRYRELTKAATDAQVPMAAVNRAMADFDLSQKRAMTSTRERLGLMSEEELISVRLAELQRQRADGIIKTDEEMVAAERNVRREVEETYQKMLVRSSRMPQLKQLELDSNNLAKSLDDGLTGSIRSFSSDIAAAANGTQKWSDVIPNLTKRLTALAAEMAVVRVVSSGVSAVMNYLMPGSAPGGAGSSGSIIPSAKGNVFAGGEVVPFRLGGVISRPTTFPLSRGRTGLAGEAGTEGIFPLKRTRDGQLGVIAAGAGGASLQQTVLVNNYGAEVDQRTNDNGDLEITVRATARDEYASHRMNSINRQKYGQWPSVKARS